MTELCFIPGFGNGQHWYTAFLDAVNMRYRVRFCPLPGTDDYNASYGQTNRILHPGSYAQFLVQSCSPATRRIWWGHSLGCRVALEAARIDACSVAVVLIDPNLGVHLPRMGRKWVPPSVFPTWYELETWYATHGIGPQEIPTAWWRQEDGRYYLRWNTEILLGFAEALPRFDLVTAIEKTTKRLPVIIVRPDLLSVNGNHQWARLRKHVPKATIIVAKGVEHNFPPPVQEQVVEKVFAQFLD